MSIASYDELKTAVSSWTDRDDLTSRIPDFITLGEAYINRMLRIRPMERRVQASTVSGTSYYGLPPRYRQMRHMKLLTSPTTDLEYVTPERLDTIYAGSTNGKPRVYTVAGDEIRLGPTPDASYTMEMLYYQAFESLSSSKPSNWLMEEAQDLLLAATLSELGPFIRDEKAVIYWTQKRDNIIVNLTTEDSKDRHSGSALSVRVEHGVY